MLHEYLHLGTMLHEDEYQMSVHLPFICLGCRKCDHFMRSHFICYYTCLSCHNLLLQLPATCLLWQWLLLSFVVLGSVWLKSQVEQSCSVLVLLLFGYKVTRTEWLQLENILLRSGTIPLQKLNGTEPLRSHPALTVTLRSVHSATKQKTEPLRSRLPNTEQNGSVPKIRDGTTLFYLAPQPNITLVFVRPPSTRSVGRPHPSLLRRPPRPDTLVWKFKTRRGLEGLKSHSYSKLNKERILAPPILSGFEASPMILRVSLTRVGETNCTAPSPLRP
jgi:hypothetical protein